MWGILQAYWPHILAVISIVTATIASAHAVMTKDEVRAAIFGGNAARIYLTKRGRRPLTSSATLRF